MEKKKILIVDDEENFTRIVKLNLEATGRYQVETENKGVNGLAVTKEFKPNLILLDVMMPGMDGGSLAFKLKEDINTKDIPIIFLTAALSKEDGLSHGSDIGGYPFIAKPVNTEELITEIEKNIGK